MRLLLDELYPPAITEQLARHGLDVVDVRDLDLAGSSDALVWARAQQLHRALVTENARDFIPLASAAVASGRHHWGLVVTSNRSLPRHRGGGVGSIVLAVVRLAGTRTDLRDRTEWVAP